MKSGFFLIDKPKGLTSFDVIRKLRKITNIRKMGHAGTLDPFATGLLIIAFGNATRTLSFFDNAVKTYIAELKFGVKTDTSDLTGKIIQEIDQPFQIEHNALINYVINLKSQVPSKFSAIKIDGKKAYELARKNLDFEMKSKTIQIHDFNIMNFNYPFLQFSAKVSSGTYIRTLSEQIAEFYQNIAHTVSLKRTAINSLTIDRSVDLDLLNEENWTQFAKSYLEIFTDLHVLNIQAQDQSKYLNGVSLQMDLEFCATEERYIVFNNDMQCLGFSKLIDKQLKPLIIFNHNE